MGDMMNTDLFGIPLTDRDRERRDTRPIRRELIRVRDEPPTMGDQRGDRIQTLIAAVEDTRAQLATLTALLKDEIGQIGSDGF